MIPFSDRTDRPRRTFPFVMIALVVANVAIYIYQLSLGETVDRVILSYGVVPYQITTGRAIVSDAPSPVYWTLISSMFLHGGILHIGANMLFLWVFGDNVEDAFGHFGFFLFYMVSGVLAGLSQVLVDPLSRTPGIGASGAIAGVLGAYLVLFPSASVRTLLILGPFITVTRISAIVLIGLWILLQFLSGVVSLGATSEGGVAYWAHIGGFVAGIILVLLYRALQPSPRRR